MPSRIALMNTEVYPADQAAGPQQHQYLLGQEPWGLADSSNDILHMLQ